MRATEMEENALRAVINLVEDSQLVSLSELLEHRVIDKCLALLNCNVTYRKTQESKNSSFNQYLCKNLMVDMGMDGHSIT